MSHNSTEKLSPDPYTKKLDDFARMYSASAADAEMEKKRTFLTASLSYASWCQLQEAVRKAGVVIPEFNVVKDKLDRDWSTRNVHYGDLRWD